MGFEARQLFFPQRLRKESLQKGQLLASLAESSASDFGVESDYYKISMMSPLRRLQQKTQVFPLDVKASSRSRLTHSLEVQAYARFIATAIINKSGAKLKPLTHQILRCVESSALIHDLGNPPFGHFGEVVIRSFLSELLNDQGLSCELRDGEKEDLCAFNGNAQGLRVLHTIHGLNLSFTQYLSTIKIPFTIAELLRGKGQGAGTHTYHSDFYSWAYGHTGVYLTEKPLLDAMREVRGTLNRHPFASIIEWADDLAYVLADLEDGFERGLVDRYDILHMCDKLARMSEMSRFEDILNHRLVADTFIHQPSEALFYLRDVIAQAYIEDLSSAVASNLELFCETGEPDFSQAACEGLTLVNLLHDYEQKKVYVNPAIESLELSGRAYLLGILQTCAKLLTEDVSTFQKELSGSGGDPFLKRVACRISRRYRETYFKACSLREHGEMYCRIRLILDYVSGMTDTYAEAEFHTITGL
ncbi:MAG: dNTP triphosphohydrolase [Succinivibrio sp.]|nr:dNTP triphosphohydrolase [Succinivibrio sp.]